MLAVPAYAKVNLALELVGRRGDGFHELRSVVVTVDWHDLVTVGLIDGRPVVESTISGAVAGLDPGADLAAAAAAALRSELGPASARRLGLAVSVHKRLPVAAGLGGGSADAAAVLRAGSELLAAPAGAAIRPAVLIELAARLGSDVPALLRGGALLVGGRGERLERLPSPHLHLAVAVAGASSTARAYAAVTPAERRPDGRAERLAARLRAGLPPLDEELGSALEPAARRASPGLAGALDRLRRRAGPARWHLTGSGGAAFALAAGAAGAAELADAARRAGLAARACRTVTAPLVDPLS